jgi:hypothetical protein
MRHMSLPKEADRVFQLRMAMAWHADAWDVVANATILHRRHGKKGRFQLQYVR